MYSVQLIAAQAALRSALLNLLIIAQTDGKYTTAVQASITYEDGDASGCYQIGSFSGDQQFHMLTGGSL